MYKKAIGRSTKRLPVAFRVFAGHSGADSEKLLPCPLFPRRNRGFALFSQFVEPASKICCFVADFRHKREHNKTIKSDTQREQGE